MASRLYKGVVDSVVDLFKGKTTQQEDTHTPDDNIDGPTLQRSPSLEEVVPVKRGRESLSPESERKRQKVLLDPTTRHLTSDYTYRTSGATPFSPVPTTREQNAAEVESRRRAAMGAPPRRGGITPMNTLRSGTRQAATAGRQNGNVEGKFKQTLYKIEVETLPTATSRGGNVATTHWPDHDQERMREEPPRKKRQLGNGMPSSPIVDLTDNDNEEDYTTAKVVPRNASKPPSGSQSSRNAGQHQRKKASSQVDTFGNYQMHAADIQAGIIRTGKQKFEALVHHDTRNIPEEIEDDDVPTSSRRTRPDSTRQSRDMPNGGRLTIDLDQGVDDYVDQHKRKRTALQANNEHGNGVSDGLNQKQNAASAVLSKRAPTPPRKRTITQADGGNWSSFDPKNSAQQRQEPRLNTVFQRDTGSDDVQTVRAVAQSKAVQRMQTTARPTSSGEDSLDELQGERTVPQRGSRSASPQKRVQKPFKQPPRLNGISPERQTSLAQSNVTNQQNIHAPKTSRKGFDPPTRDAANDDDEGDKIPIYSIGCKALGFKEDKDMELVWNDALEGYYVAWMRELLKNPNTQTPVCIRRSHIREIVHSVGYASFQLKGPAGDDSNGNVVIFVQTQEGKDALFRRLDSGDRKPQDTQKPFDKLRDILSKQKEEQREAHRRFLKQAPKIIAPTGTSQRAYAANQGRRTAQNRPREPSPERMKYDSASEDEGDDMASALRREDYQQPRQRLEATDTNTSKYFAPQNDHQQAKRRSTRQTKPVMKARSPTPPPKVPKWSEENSPKRWNHPVTYPWQGTKRTTVEFTDLPKLDYDEWLNDNIINFEMRWIEENMNADFKDKVHFFNTFFYNTMTTKVAKKGINYSGVQRWTKTVDIFTKPYIVVPINLSSHWFLAIICNLPNRQRKYVDSDEDPAQDSEAAEPSSDSAAPQVDEQAEAIQSEPPDQRMEDLSISDDSAEAKLELQAGNGDVFEFGEDDRVIGSELKDTQSSNFTAKANKRKKKGRPSLPKYDTSDPVLITLDSFGFPRSREVAPLKEYLRLEAKTKRSMDFDPKDLPAMTAKGIPVQKNFSDCGIFLLAYLEKFAQNPDEFVRKILQREMTEDEFGDFVPLQKRNEIREKLLELSTVQDRLHRERREAKAAEKKAAESAQQSREASASRKSPSKSRPPSRQKTPISAAKHGEQVANQPTPSREDMPEQRAGRAGARDDATDTKAHRGHTFPSSPYQTSQTMTREEQDDGMELEVSAPLVVGQRPDQQPYSNAPQLETQDQINSGESEEILDVVADTDELAQGRRLATPIQYASRQDPSPTSPLGVLETYAKSETRAESSEDHAPEDNALTPDPAAGDQEHRAGSPPDVIDLDDSDITDVNAVHPTGRRASPEIPDSQEQGKPISVKTSQGKVFTYLD